MIAFKEQDANLLPSMQSIAKPLSISTDVQWLWNAGCDQEVLLPNPLRSGCEEQNPKTVHTTRPESDVKSGNAVVEK